MKKWQLYIDLRLDKLRLFSNDITYTHLINVSGGEILLGNLRPLVRKLFSKLATPQYLR